LVVAGAFAMGATGSTGPGRAGDPLWGGAALLRLAPGDRPTVLGEASLRGESGGPYVPGLLAIRVGRLVAAVLRLVGGDPAVAIVDATGRDHPRRAGLALHLGAALGLPTVGVTDRPLVAGAGVPGPDRGAIGLLTLEGETVGAVVRTRRGARPVVAHAAWRTSATVARDVVLFASAGFRTPEPIRWARRLARRARAIDEGRAPGP
jgi:deoxyribonuclease V